MLLKSVKNKFKKSLNISLTQHGDSRYFAQHLNVVYRIYSQKDLNNKEYVNFVAIEDIHNPSQPEIDYHSTYYAKTLKDIDYYTHMLTK